MDSIEVASRLPVRHLSINQVVAWNLAYWRKIGGLSQEQLGERLGGWSKASVSAAERSWDGKRIRQFSADDIASIALALGVPITALFLPPPDSDTKVSYTFTAGPDQLGQSVLLAHLGLADFPADSPAMAVYRQRMMTLGASGYASPARGDATLAESRELAERHISELRAFEREYRSTLLAHLERQVSNLRAGALSESR